MQLKWPMRWDLFSLFPAHAGVILSLHDEYITPPAFPRTRGGDPLPALITSAAGLFSPHTRG